MIGLWCSSLLVPFLVNSLYEYFSAFQKQTAFGSALEKQCAFLLCNGLLAIIFTSSGLIGNVIPPQTALDSATNDTRHVPKTTPEIANSSVALEHVDFKEEELAIGKMDNEEQEELAIVKMDEEEEEEELAIVKMDNEKEEKLAIVKVDEGEEEEAIVELLCSAEEFNKKCEDFIRRVKEEIKLGGR